MNIESLMTILSYLAILIFGYLTLKEFLTPGGKKLLHDIYSFIKSLGFCLLFCIALVMIVSAIVILIMLPMLSSILIVVLIFVCIWLMGCVEEAKYDETLRNRDSDYAKNIDILRKQYKAKYGKNYFRTKEYKREKESLDWNKEQLDWRVNYTKEYVGSEKYKEDIEELEKRNRFF